MRSKVILLGLTPILLLLSFECGSKDAPTSGQLNIKEVEEIPKGEDGSTGQIAFHVRYVLPSGKVARPAVVDKMTAYVYEPEGTKITEANLEKVGDRGKASITVIAGDNRRVDIVAYDGALVSWMGSDTDVDVVAGQTTTADIAMQSTVPILADLPDTSETGSYTVSWGSISEATSYTLQENGANAYVGANTSVAISGKGQGNYSYKVKATIEKYGDSSWSIPDSVEVKFPPSEGRIDIDVPWPPEGNVQTFPLPGGATIEMVWIEPGTFVMGSPATEEGRRDWEGPQHNVTITKGFWLGKYEITQGQWEAVMGTTPWSGKSNVQEGPNFPAVIISWNDIQAFIAKCNEHEGAEAYRLPTEAEWEYACRAGTETIWCFGDDESELINYAWYKDNALDMGEGYAHEVGTRLPNLWGLYDMHGNVWEWCQSCFEGYPSTPQSDPTGPATGFRVHRGGNFDREIQYTRSADRGYDTPDTVSDHGGARLLRMGP